MGRFAGYFTMSKLAFLVSNYSDAILIAIFYGTVPVTIFALTQKLSSAAFMFVSRVGPVAIPGLAEMMGKSDVRGLQDITLRMARVLTRIGILVAVMIVALNHRFVSMWTGEATYGGSLLTALFAWGIFRDTVIRNLSSVLFASGELKGWGLLSAFEALMKLGIAVTLLPVLGIVAPMIGTAIAELITGVYTPLKLSRLIGLKPRRLLDSAMLPALARSVPTIIVIAVLAYAVPHEWRWFGILAIAAGGAITNVVAFDSRAISVFLKSRSVTAS
jgi:O-antigen/teichoic acid export membrane protein